LGKRRRVAGLSGTTLTEAGGGCIGPLRQGGGILQFLPNRIRLRNKLSVSALGCPVHGLA